MTPMLDIVFIMLIFFIVTTSFVKESGIDVHRPTAATATTVDKANIIIAIEANGAVWIDKRQIDIASVRANIEQLKVENPEGAVVIQADVDSRSGLVVEVMDQVRLAGIQKISLAADKPR
ncbi:biopolymer transporter ExbD [Pelagibaculum spongiae]|uniref:Biopolymer transporter ExbD n=2 Tax=Pelagibaculum spongiae TaxID=2080658 RepID=A0A2V1H800_9GAMM|nr:biopolymer transporter ExbD [Pelagibaculum spongiae]